MGVGGWAPTQARPTSPLGSPIFWEGQSPGAHVIPVVSVAAKLRLARAWPLSTSEASMKGWEWRQDHVSQPIRGLAP